MIVVYDLISFYKSKKSILHIILITIFFIILLSISNVRFFVMKYYDNYIKDYDNYIKDIKSNFEGNYINDILNIEPQSNILTISSGYQGFIDDDRINQIQKINHVKEVVKEQRTEETVIHYFIIVDTWKSINYVKSKCNDLGYEVNESNIISEILENYTIIITSLNIFLYTVLIISSIIIFFYIYEMIMEEKINIFILKIVGYDNRKIMYIFSRRIVSVLIVCYIIARLVLIWLNILINIVMNKLGFENYIDLIKNNTNVQFLIIFLIISWVSMFFAYEKTKKIN